MHNKKLLSLILAILSGGILGAAIKIGYALPGVLPTSDLFVYIITSPLGLLAIKSTGGKAGVMLAVLMRAFPYSILLGVAAGMALHKITYQRAFCYAALWLPISNLLLGYITISNLSIPNLKYLPALQEKLGEVLWVNFCVYGWYFMALYLSFAASRRFMHNLSFKRDALKRAP